MYIVQTFWSFCCQAFNLHYVLLCMYSIYTCMYGVHIFSTFIIYVVSDDLPFFYNLSLLFYFTLIRHDRYLAVWLVCLYVYMYVCRSVDVYMYIHTYMLHVHVHYIRPHVRIPKSIIKEKLMKHPSIHRSSHPSAISLPAFLSTVLYSTYPKNFIAVSSHSAALFTYLLLL